MMIVSSSLLNYFHLKNHHTLGTPALAYREDGKQLASISVEGIICCWSVPYYHCEYKSLMNKEPWLLKYLDHDTLFVCDRYKILPKKFSNTIFQNVGNNFSDGHTRDIAQVCYNHEGSLIASKSKVFQWSDHSADLRILTWNTELHTSTILQYKKHEILRFIYFKNQLLGYYFDETKSINSFLINLETHKKVFEFKNYSYAIASLAFHSPTNLFVSGGYDIEYHIGDSSIKISEINDAILQCKKTIKLDTDAISCVTVSNNGHQIASASGLIIRIWNQNKAQHNKILSGHSEFITTLIYYPNDAGLLSIDRHGNVFVWDIQHCKIINYCNIPGHFSAAITSDLSKLAIGINESLWHLSAPTSFTCTFPHIPPWQLQWRRPNLSLMLNNMNINQSQINSNIRDFILERGGIDHSFPSENSNAKNKSISHWGSTNNFYKKSDLDNIPKSNSIIKISETTSLLETNEDSSEINIKCICNLV